MLVVWGSVLSKLLSALTSLGSGPRTAYVGVEDLQEMLGADPCVPRELLVHSDFLEEPPSWKLLDPAYTHPFGAHHWSYRLGGFYGLMLYPSWYRDADPTWENHSDIHCESGTGIVGRLRYRCWRHEDCRAFPELGRSCLDQTESIRDWLSWLPYVDELVIHPSDWDRVEPLGVRSLFGSITADGPAQTTIRQEPPRQPPRFKIERHYGYVL